MGDVEEAEENHQHPHAMLGVLILEVMCGRRPVKKGKPPLMDWAWDAVMSRGEPESAMDGWLLKGGGGGGGGGGGYDPVEAERVLRLGLMLGERKREGEVYIEIRVEGESGGELWVGEDAAAGGVPGAAQARSGCEVCVAHNYKNCHRLFFFYIGFNFI